MKLIPHDKVGQRNGSGVAILKGRVINKIDYQGGDVITFYLTDGTSYRMFHEQECCEAVYLEDIIGDLDDLVGIPLSMAEEVSEIGDPLDDHQEQWSSWVFYKFAGKGYVTIRWYGESNLNYSIGADFRRIA